MTTSSISPPARLCGFGMESFRPCPRRSRRTPRPTRRPRPPRHPPSRPPPSPGALRQPAPPGAPQPPAPQQLPLGLSLGLLALRLGRRLVAFLDRGLGLRRALGVDGLRLLPGGRDGGRDQLLVDAPAPLGDSGGLSDPAPQVVELRPAHVSAGGDLEFLDLRRVQRERPLDADAEGLLADRERLARARALALEDDALEDLGAAAVALDHLEVDAHAIARVEAGKTLPQLAPLDAVDHAAHRFLATPRTWREKTAGPVPGAARLRNGTYSGRRSKCSARARLCATRHSRTRSWSPETRTSGTSQPR